MSIHIPCKRWLELRHIEAKEEDRITLCGMTYQHYFNVSHEVDTMIINTERNADCEACILLRFVEEAEASHE